MLTVRLLLRKSFVSFGLVALLGACGGGGGGGANGGDGGGSGGSGGKKGGNGGNGSGGNGSGGNGSGGDTGGSGGDGSVPAPMGSNACGPLPAAPIRRLSRQEYVATIRDLFPKSFPPDSDGVWRIDNHSLSFMRGTQTISWNWKVDMVEDPNTFGFENRAKNLNPTTALIENRDENSETIAEYVWGKINAGTGDAIVPCTDKTVDCGKQWIGAFAPQVYRRPLTDDEKKRLEDYFTSEFNMAKGAGVEPFEAAGRLTLEVMLNAPQFQYRIELGDPATKSGAAVKLDQYETANRLSYTLWSSKPDQTLFDAAKKGELKTADQLEAQARRMMKDPRFRFMVIEYFRQWGEYERIFGEGYRRKAGYSLGDVKHPYPIFYALAARHEVEQLAEWLMTDGDGSVNTFLTTTKSWVSSFSKAIYSGKLIADAMEGTPDFNYTATDLDATQRAGFLTRIHFNWAHSRFDTPSPPLRGSFVMSKLLCTHLPPPPADALSQPVDLSGAVTNRAKFEKRVTARTDCPGCHTRLDGIGFTFENYGETGLFKSTDGGQPVNPKGKIVFGTDVDGDVANAIELSKKLGGSTTVRQCMLKQVYEYMTARDAALDKDEDGSDVDKCRVDGLDKALVDKKGDLREAIVAWVKSPDFVWRPAQAQ